MHDDTCVYDLLVLGGGISGLSFAWYLKKKHPHIKMKILEQSDTPGGWIKSWKSPSGQMYELGPRSFRASAHNGIFLDLIRQLSLEDDLIYASPHAKNRYIYLEKKLTPLPRSLGDLLFSKLGVEICKAIFKDLFCLPKEQADESVYSFVARRYGDTLANSVADCLMTGIFGCSAKDISFECAFPELFERQRYGSLIVGSLIDAYTRNKKNAFQPDKPFKKGIATLKHGLTSLTDALARELHEELQVHTSVQAIQEGNPHSIVTNMGVYKANKIVLALPSYVLEEILGLKRVLRYTSLCTVSFGFREDGVLPEGFGFLCPTTSHPELLGVVFDSVVFPEQSVHSGSRCTVMLGGAKAPFITDSTDENIIQTALKVLSEILMIHQKPFETKVSRAKSAIPQFSVGFNAYRSDVSSQLEAKGIHCLGSSFSGVSLSDCVFGAFTLSERIFEGIF